MHQFCILRTFGIIFTVMAAYVRELMNFIIFRECKRYAVNMPDLLLEYRDRFLSDLPWLMSGPAQGKQGQMGACPESGWVWPGRGR